MAPKKTIVEPSWEAKYSYSPAVITEGGKIIWLAGHVGVVDDIGDSLAGNFDAQTRQAFKNLEKTLDRAGGSFPSRNLRQSDAGRGVAPCRGPTSKAMPLAGGRRGAPSMDPR